MEKKIKISAVSYLNSLPFIFGLENYENFSKQIDLQKDIPSVCADKLINNNVDIGLIPVAEIRKIKKPFVISNYCIGAVGKVETVLLLSDVPVNEIKRVFLDYHSRTSVNLLKILFKKHWKRKVDYIVAEKGFENKISDKTGGLIIGDRAFLYSEKYKYVYDLSEEWTKLTKLPFVFAAWVSNKKINEDFVKEFNSALEFGLKNKKHVINIYKSENNNSKIDIEKYLNSNISYFLNSEKRKGMELFLKLLRRIDF